MPFKAEKEKLRREAMQQIKNQRPTDEQQPPPQSPKQVTQSYNKPNYQDLIAQQHLNQNRIDGYNQMYYNQQAEQNHFKQSNKKEKFRLFKKMNNKVKEVNIKQKQKRLEKQEEDKMNLTQEDYIMKYANRGKAVKGVFLTILFMFILYLFYIFFN